MSSPRPVFYFDLGSPYAYLAAERVNALFADACGQPPEWQPVLLGVLFKRFGRDSWANGPGREKGIREIERRASHRGLAPVRWPDPFPGNTLFAMRAATYAKEIGRTVAFSLAVAATWLVGLARSLIRPVYSTWLNQSIDDSSVRATVNSIASQSDAIGEVAVSVAAIAAVEVAITSVSVAVDVAIVAISVTAINVPTASVSVRSA